MEHKDTPPPEQTETEAYILALEQRAYQNVELLAGEILAHYNAQQEAEDTDTVVFSLATVNPDENLPDFSGMLAGNARILNAAFEYYLENARESKAADAKIMLALRAQGQLSRTIDAWRRLAQFQNGGTK